VGPDVFPTHLDTGKTRHIATLPGGYEWGSGFAVNADETLLAGTWTERGAQFTSTMPRTEWSVHYNISWGGKLFAGDGGGPRSVAALGNGRWIYLFRPKKGALQAEKLVALSRHDYALEPNVMFMPDGKWIIFRSNMYERSYVYAVEIAKPR
jgi:oligogalacturonide lyase